MGRGYDKLLDLPGAVGLPEAPVHVIGRLDVLAATLMLFGAFNWGVLAWTGIDWVSASLGDGSWLARSVHGLVGLAPIQAVLILIRLRRPL